LILRTGSSDIFEPCLLLELLGDRKLFSQMRPPQTSPTVHQTHVLQLSRYPLDHKFLLRTVSYVLVSCRGWNSAKVSVVQARALIGALRASCQNKPFNVLGCTAFYSCMRPESLRPELQVVKVGGHISHWGALSDSVNASPNPVQATKLSDQVKQSMCIDQKRKVL